jgi:hypothetical protein
MPMTMVRRLSLPARFALESAGFVLESLNSRVSSRSLFSPMTYEYPRTLRVPQVCAVCSM